jgi:hypothetical protein
MISPDRKKPLKGRRRTEAATFEALWKHAVKSMHAGKSEDGERSTPSASKRAPAKARSAK